MQHIACCCIRSLCKIVWFYSITIYLYIKMDKVTLLGVKVEYYVPEPNSAIVIIHITTSSVGLINCLNKSDIIIAREVQSGDPGVVIDQHAIKKKYLL